jgi:nucleotide-binding universal stress UspA family protein
MKEKILFVTKGGEGCDEGFSYALELAKALNSGIAVLMVYPRQMLSSFDDVMSAAAFAEAGDFNTVKTLLDSQEKALRETEEKKVGEMIEKAREISINLIHKVASGDVANAIKDYLKNRPGVDMVLLSPTLAGNKKILDIKKLLKNISKPIVNITLPARAEAYQ